MEDRRRERRKKLVAFTPVYKAEKHRLVGYLDNLTLNGAKVIGEQALKIDERGTFVIELPGLLDGVSEKAVKIPARVARCVPDEEASQTFDIGLEFTEMTPENTRIIQALINRYHFHY